MSAALQPPARGPGDAAHALAKAALGSVPLVGATATEVFNWVVSPPIERRRDHWMAEVGETLRRLEVERGVDLEALEGDERFIDTVLQATHVAMRNAGAEKRQALRNAILNSGLPSAPDESRRQVFLRYIDVLTPWHLRLLHLFDDPVAWFRAHGRPWPDTYGHRGIVLGAAFPEAIVDDEFTRQLWRDLHSNGLVATASLGGSITPPGMRESLTTPLGQEFLAFITDRRPDDSPAV